MTIVKTSPESAGKGPFVSDFCSDHRRRHGVAINLVCHSRRRVTSNVRNLFQRHSRGGQQIQGGMPQLVRMPMT